MPAPTQESVEVAVARASGRVCVRERNPEARSVRTGAAVEVTRRAGSAQAAGSAKQISAAERATPVGAPADPARSPASAGPTRLAKLKVIASSAWARGSDLRLAA